jgi:hypothetical protein
MIKTLTAFVALATPVFAQEALELDSSQSTLTYHLVHKLHKIDATSKKVAGKAMLQPDGRAQVELSAPVESFDSENVNRDEHMKETVEASRFPTVELKAIGEAKPPAVFPGAERKTFKAQISFHGQKQVIEVPVQLNWESSTKVKATASFKISLEAFKVERPSLMFVKVDDNLALDAKLLFKK